MNLSTKRLCSNVKIFTCENMVFISPKQFMYYRKNTEEKTQCLRFALKYCHKGKMRDETSHMRTARETGYMAVRYTTPAFV